MKKLLIFCVAVGFVFAFGNTAMAADYGDTHGPSSALILGAMGTEWGGSPGYVIAEPFQLNLLYQDGIDNGAIDAFNTYDAGGWTANFSDNECYVFNFNVDGNLFVYTYPEIRNNYDPNIQWRLTGWHNTILAGDIVDLGNSILFKVIPFATYRPFPWDELVNNVEVFDGRVACEVFGYFFDGALEDIGEGSVLIVVPENEQDCKKGGWATWGFNSQGQCLKCYNIAK